MNVTPKTVARQITVARAQRALRPVYTTATGDMPSDLRTGQRLVEVKTCADVREFGTHVLTDVLADLPGDRSVGYCSCGKYMDTGTFDERNA